MVSSDSINAYQGNHSNPNSSLLTSSFQSISSPQGHIHLAQPAVTQLCGVTFTQCLPSDIGSSIEVSDGAHWYLTGVFQSTDTSQSYESQEVDPTAILKGSLASLTLTLNQSSQSCSLPIGFQFSRFRLIESPSGHIFTPQRYISLTGVEPIQVSTKCLSHI